MTRGEGPVTASWVLFDLNGTLLDPACLAQELGGDRDRPLVEHAFDEAILHAMADTLSGAYRPLPDYLRSALERRLRLTGRPTERVDAAMHRAEAMDPFPDARQAIECVVAAGLRAAVLSNSSTDAARGSLERAGLVDTVAAVIGSDSVGVFKPHPDVYRHALGELDVRGEDAWMVAAHGWDLAGAGRVGLRTAWVSRKEQTFPSVFPPPDVEAADLVEVVAEVSDLR